MLWAIWIAGYLHLDPAPPVVEPEPPPAAEAPVEPGPEPSDATPPEPPPGPTLDDALALKQAQRLPEAEQLLLTLAAKSPEDAAVLIQLATVQGWQSKFAPSTATWRKVVALRPDDPDARVGLARVLYWSEQRAEAIEQLKRALALRPQMPDAHALLGDVYRAEGDMRAARASYERARAAGDASPELAQKIEQAVPAPLVRADTGATYDFYSPNAAGRTREWSAFAQVGATLGQLIPSLRFETFHYFGNTDSSLTAGLVYRVTREAVIAADGSYTPDLPQFRPKWQVNLGGEVAFTPQVTALATYRHMYFYDFGAVDMVMPALRFQFGPGFEAQAGGVVAHNADETVTGAFVARVSYAWRDTLFPYAGFSYGQESLPPLATANTIVGTLGVVWSITPRLSVRADYAHEHRTTLADTPIYDHDSIGAAVTLRL